jgi:hypothetical protein
MLIERNLNSDGLFDYSVGRGAFAFLLPHSIQSNLHTNAKQLGPSALAGFALFRLIIPLHHGVSVFSPAGKHEVDGREGGEGVGGCW